MGPSLGVCLDGRFRTKSRGGQREVLLTKGFDVTELVASALRRSWCAHFLYMGQRLCYMTYTC